MPPRSLIEAHTNIKLSGYWPTYLPDNDNLDRSALKQLGIKYDLPEKTSVGGTPEFLEQYYDEFLRKLKFCTDEEIVKFISAS